MRFLYKIEYVNEANTEVLSAIVVAFSREDAIENFYYGRGHKVILEVKMVDNEKKQRKVRGKQLMKDIDFNKKVKWDIAKMFIPFIGTYFLFDMVIGSMLSPLTWWDNGEKEPSLIILGSTIYHFVILLILYAKIHVI